MQDLLGHAKDLAPSVVALRRDLHRWPELGLHTPRTRDAVLAALEGLPLDVTLHDTTSGVAALLTGGLALDSGLLAAMQEEMVNEKVNVEARSHPDSIFAGAIGAAIWGAYRHAKLAELEAAAA